VVNYNKITVAKVVHGKPSMIFL